MKSNEQELERAFSRVFHRAIANNDTYASWSIAELRLTAEDLSWLGAWFSELGEEVRTWVDEYRRPAPRECLDGRQFNLRQMFGGLLIVQAAELWRRDGREDVTSERLWPLVLRTLPRHQDWVRRVFPAGQPSENCKTCLKDAALHLDGFRHFFDEASDAGQAYFDTIKLQGGFSKAGLRGGLSRWLVGYQPPLAVQALRGLQRPEWKSDSFIDLWARLRRFRRGVLKQDDLVPFLAQSPWILDDWLHEVIQAARLHIETLGFGEGDEGEDSSERHVPAPQPRASEGAHPSRPIELVEENPFADIVEGFDLTWPPGSRPKLKIRLAREELARRADDPSITDLDFEIDGQDAPGRWHRSQTDKSWGGSTEIESRSCDRRAEPNLRPQLLRIYAEQRDIALVDLTPWKVADEIAIYDVAGQAFRSCDSAMDPRREYFLLANANISLSGLVNPSSAVHRNRRLWRLDPSWPDAIELRQDGHTLWRPTISGRRDPDPMPYLKLKAAANKSCVLGSDTVLTVEGIPDGTTTAELLIGSQAYPLIKRPSVFGWETGQGIPITAELTLRCERLRARLACPGKSRLVPVAPALRPTGLLTVAEQGSAEEAHHWLVHSPEERINLEGRACNILGRVFGGENEAEAVLWEGFRRLGIPKRRELIPDSLMGWGDRLQIQRPSDSLDGFCLASAAVDHGTVKGFLRLGNSFTIFLRGKKRLDGDFTWLAVAPCSETGLKAIMASCSNQTNEGSRTWKPILQTDPKEWAAVALAFRGLRSGAWWDHGKLLGALDKCRTASPPGKADLRPYFALLRWLKAPVLMDSYQRGFQAAVFKRYLDFVRAWFFGEGLPQGLRFDTETEEPVIERAGREAVARNYLWNWSPWNLPDAENRGTRMSQAFLGQGERKITPDVLHRIGLICPPLLGRLALAARIEHKAEVLKTTLEHFLAGEASGVANHEGFSGVIASQFRLGADGLETLSREFVGWSLRSNSAEPSQWRILRCIAEDVRGRKWLSALLLRALIEQRAR